MEVEDSATTMDSIIEGPLVEDWAAMEREPRTQPLGGRTAGILRRESG